MTIDERIASELRRHAPQVDELMAWDRIQSTASLQKRDRALRLVPISVAALGFVLLGIILVSSLSSEPGPATAPQSPILGTWVGIDFDGRQTMTIGVSRDDAVEIAVHDDFASVCSGAPSTMTGIGRFESSTELVIPSPVLTCDDGSRPQALTGPPLEEQLRNLTFVYDPQTDALSDSFGMVWGRVGGEDPSPERPGMWPQSSPEEVREAQLLADAGDPDYTWQLEPDLGENLGSGNRDNPEIFARFLREELGWEEFALHPGLGFGDGTIELTYIKCAPGENNPIYPDDLDFGGCAPTIDEFRYETVTITVGQPGQRGPTGIWVVTRWAIVEPVEQVVPLTDAEATAILEAFLQARIDGEGAEQYGGAALLYATTTGAPYERFEFETVADPDWPSGRRGFEVRLFAEDGQTVVEQSFSVARDEAGRWGPEPGGDTVENGRTLPIHDVLGGEVIFRADHPWQGSFFGHSYESNGKQADANLFYLESEGQIRVLADPRPIGMGCQEIPAAANAEGLAQSILSNGDFEATAPLAVTIGGAPALQMDVVTTLPYAGARFCDGPRSAVSSDLLYQEGNRMRLYLVDLPGGSARILSIAIIAPEDHFERVLEAATPVLDSFEFHTR